MRRTGVPAPHFPAGPCGQPRCGKNSSSLRSIFRAPNPAGAPMSDHSLTEAVHVVTIPVALLAPPGRRRTPSVPCPPSLRGRTGAARALVALLPAARPRHIDVAGGRRLHGLPLAGV